MKDYLSLFLLQNSLAARMKKNLANFCTGAGSTSTLDQTRPANPDLSGDASSLVSSCSPDRHGCAGAHQTLEEMILQLEIEEEAARKAKLAEYGRRMSCVNNSDILRSARNALNQYPRFSLDGRDAMYRSSFRNIMGCNGEGGIGRRSVCCSYGHGLDLGRSLGLPPKLAGENVVWCKPGVVGKLMGLEAMPVPISSRQGGNKGRVNVGKKEEFMRFERQRRLNRKGDGRSQQQRWKGGGGHGYYGMKQVKGGDGWENMGGAF